MREVSRLSAKEVREGVQAGSLLLVCAYEEDEKYEKNKLEGAIPLSAFKANLSGYNRNGRIAFYWAWTNDSRAAGLAAKYAKEEGFTDTHVLHDGPKGWREAGYPIL